MKLVSGPFRGEKIEYSDGVGCCIWIPFDEYDDGFGLAWDFDAADIDDLLRLVRQLKEVEAEPYEPDS